MVGRSVLAVVDPGPEAPEHLEALTGAVTGAERVAVVLTPGHRDHAGGAAALAEAVGCEVWGPDTVDVVGRPVPPGDAVETDEGALVAVATPGHTADHLCYHWPERRALFAGDMLLGRGDTTWVAEYPGCVADYLDSLERLRGLELDTIYPAHGPALTDPADALDRFERHRRSRIAQLREALAGHPEADLEELLERVYGGALPDAVRGAARTSLAALVEYVRDVPG